MLEEPNVASLQVEIEHPNVHGLSKMDLSVQPQSDQILPNYSGNIAVNIYKTKAKPSQANKKIAIILGNFPKRITRTKGLGKDVTQCLTNHGDLEGSNKRKEVMKLLAMSLSKARGNPISLGTSKKIPLDKSEG